MHKNALHALLLQTQTAAVPHTVTAQNRLTSTAAQTAQRFRELYAQSQRFMRLNSYAPLDPFALNFFANPCVLAPLRCLYAVALRKLPLLSPISPSPSQMQRQRPSQPPDFHRHFAIAATAANLSRVPAEVVHEQRQNTVSPPRTAAISVAIVGFPAHTLGGNFAKTAPTAFFSNRSVYFSVPL